VPETITIQIPDTPKEREEIMQFLIAKGLVQGNKESATGISKWARLADELAEANALGDGLGDIFRSGTKEFRENFAFKSELNSEE
jgi:hypothetical protein